MNGTFSGRSVLVLGGGEAGASVARGLATLGATVATDIGEIAAAVDLVVIPVIDPGGLSPSPIADMDEVEWISRCEAPLAALRAALTDAHRALSQCGGQIILLVPTIAMNGAAGFAPYSALGEGARALAKSVARNWGTAGITVNCLALTQEQLMPGSGEAVTERRVPQALRTPDMEKDVAFFIATLAFAPPVTTGGTIMLDGGIYMPV